MSHMQMSLQNRKCATDVGSKRSRSCLTLNLLLVFVCALGRSAQAYANTYFEVEPNDTCASAQDLRSASSPLQVQGYKTQPFGNAVDFFIFSGEAGTRAQVTLNGNFSSAQPLTAYGIGVFTSNCPASPMGSAFSISSEAALDFTIPADGIFVIAVTACCDLGFSGSGTIEGAYVLAVTGAIAAPVAPALISSTPAGRAYGQWAAAFWQWVLGVPDNNYRVRSRRQRVNPLKNVTGEHCAEHQIGDVWFLAGSWVGSVNRSCTIPAGKSLFFPLINNVYVGFLTDPPEQRTEQFARDQAACTESAVISVSVDDIEINNPTSYFTGPSGSQSPVFNVQMPFGVADEGPGNLLESLGCKIEQVREWFLSPSAEQGYYLFLNPLPAGLHKLQWNASGRTAGSTQDVTYNVTVLGQ
jgi:hypothetical protein